MPTYEYECSKCKKEFEIFQSMKDDSLKVCPKGKMPDERRGAGRERR